MTLNHLNLLDYFILLVIVLGGLAGYHHGLIRTVGAVASTLLGLWAAACLGDDIALYLEERFRVVSAVGTFLQDKFPLPVLVAPEAGVPHSASTGTAGLTGTLHGGMAYLLVLAVSFLALYLVITRLSSLLWTTATWVLGWGPLGSFNRLGGLVVGAGLKALSLAVAIGLLVPVTEAGAQMQFGWAIAARAYLASSSIAPYLDRVFGFFTHLAGLNL